MAALGWFFGLTFVLTWTCFILAGTWLAGASDGSSAAVARLLLLFVGIFAPSIIALALTARDGGQAGVMTLLGRLFEWRVPPRWYVFAAGYVLAIELTTAGLYRVITGEWPRFGAEPLYVLLAGTLLSLMTLGQAGEELGWRGYAMPRLAARFGAARASLLLGAIWAAWHLPLFYIPGADTTGQSFPFYLLQVLALSVAMTWLYTHTGGSLLLAMLMHAAINNTKDIVPHVGSEGTDPWRFNPSLLSWLTLVTLWTSAIYFLIRMPRDAGSE